MNSVKGRPAFGRRGYGQMARHKMCEPVTMADWDDETEESELLRRALIEAGRTAIPRQDPARLERVFRRILAQLEREGRDGIPAPRLETPSGVTAKTFG